MRKLLFLIIAAGSIRAETFVVTVAGLGGEPDYQTRFNSEAADLDKIFKSSGTGLHVYTLSGVDSTRAKLLSALQQVAAAAKAQDDFVLILIGHGSYDGAAYWRRIKTFYPLIPGGSWSVGENLLWASGSVDAREAVRIWMQSPEHRRNILMPKWHQIGIGIGHESDAPGVYEDLSVTVLTTDFGVR